MAVPWTAPQAVPKSELITLAHIGPVVIRAWIIAFLTSYGFRRRFPELDRRRRRSRAFLQE